MPPTHNNYEFMTVGERSGSLLRQNQPVANTEPVATQADTEQSTVITSPDSTITAVDPEIRARNCEAARNNAELINARRRIVVNDENGESRRLTDVERNNLSLVSQDYLDENC